MGTELCRTDKETESHDECNSLFRVTEGVDPTLRARLKTRIRITMICELYCQTFASQSMSTNLGRFGLVRLGSF